jgi:hypothetical protein
MTLMLPMLHELVVLRGQLEMKAWRNEDPVRDDVSLSLEVRSSELNDDARKVAGEIILNSSPGYEGAVPMSGSFIFYTADRFHAEIEVPEAMLMRIWNCYAGRPDWLMVQFWEGPEIPTVAKTVEGQFRLGCRAGYERPVREAY